jgi:hypothetical protein
MSDNMATGLGFIKAVADQAPTSVSSFDAMTGNVSNFVNALDHSLDEMIRAREMAAEFLSLSGETKADVGAGISNLVTAATLAATAASDGSGFAPQSASQTFTSQITPTAPISPVAPVVPTQGQSHTYQDNRTITIEQINLNGDPAPEEIVEIVDRAVEKARERWIREEQHSSRQWN